MSRPKVDLVKRRPRKVTLPMAYVVLVPVIALVFAVITCIGYTRHVDNNRAKSVARLDAQRAAAEREADRRWCALLNLITRAASATPPTTEFGREYLVLIADLRRQFQCGE